MTRYEEMSYDELIQIVDNHKCAFLCGNGLSINFDEGYLVGKLTERLFETHCHLFDNISFEVCADEKYNSFLKENFQGTFDVLEQIKSRKDFDRFYSSALEFAKSVANSKKVMNWLKQNGYNIELVFGLSIFSLLETLVAQADEDGVFNVNYEYLTILIYFVIALRKAPQELYRLDITNLFVQAVLRGCKYEFTNLKGSSAALSNVAISGMFAYYRFLFASNILMNGKSYDVKRLQHWNDVDRQAFKKFLNRFDYVMTTNYDKILENITNQPIYHLHGQFSLERNVVLNQSLGVKCGRTIYDISSIIIGDYFLSKSLLPNSANLAMTRGNNSKYYSYSNILEKVIKFEHTEAVVILGLNIENDYHILRELQVFLESGGVKCPQIIYCYFTEADKDSFLDVYDKCITYSDEVSQFVRNNIGVYVVKTPDVLKHILRNEAVISGEQAIL